MDIFSLKKKKKKFKYVILTQFYSNEFHISYCCISYLLNRYRFFWFAILFVFKIHVIELGPYKNGNFAPRNSYDHIQFLDDADRYDFPVALHVSLHMQF